VGEFDGKSKDVTCCFERVKKDVPFKLQLVAGGLKRTLQTNAQITQRQQSNTENEKAI